MLDTLNAILNVNFTTALIVAALVAGSGAMQAFSSLETKMPTP
jgi:hypothetical protein